MAKRRYGMNEARIERLERMGRGRGSGPAYLPWLTIHDLSSHGRSHRIRGETARRVHHFFSDIELAVFLDFDWHPDVVDIREQFPLGRDATRSIAAEMGVQHPRHHGVDVVMTTDLLVDVERDGRRGQVAVAVKPASQLGVTRVVAKLEIERRFWARRGVRTRIITDEETSRTRTHNLLWLHEARWLQYLDVPHPAHWSDRCAALLSALRESRDRCVRDFTTRLEATLGWEPGAALFAIRHMVANRVLEIDLDSNFDASGPMRQLRPACGLFQAG